MADLNLDSVARNGHWRTTNSAAPRILAC